MELITDFKLIYRQKPPLEDCGNPLQCVGIAGYTFKLGEVLYGPLARKCTKVTNKVLADVLRKAADHIEAVTKDRA